MSAAAKEEALCTTNFSTKTGCLSAPRNFRWSISQLIGFWCCCCWKEGELEGWMDGGGGWSTWQLRASKRFVAVKDNRHGYRFEDDYSISDVEEDDKNKQMGTGGCCLIRQVLIPKSSFDPIPFWQWTYNTPTHTQAMHNANGFMQDIVLPMGLYMNSNEL